MVKRDETPELIKARQEAAKSRVRVYVTHLAAAFVFGGGAVLVVVLGAGWVNAGDAKVTALKDRVHDAGDLFGPPASGPVRPEASAQPSSIALIYAPTLWLLAAMGTRVGGRGLKRSPPPSLTLSWNAVTGILPDRFRSFPASLHYWGAAHAVSTIVSEGMSQEVQPRTGTASGSANGFLKAA